MENQSNIRVVNKIIVHCSDTYKRMDIDAATIRNWHVLERGWSDIGYHFVIKHDGTIETGRDLDQDGDIFEEIGAHTYGYNKNSIGVCLVGGKADNGEPENNFTKDQFESLEAIINVIKYDYPDTTVHGHREFANKACPSFDVQKWLETVDVG